MPSRRPFKRLGGETVQTRDGQRGLDRGLALASGLVAIAFYLPTLYPDLGGGGDAAKFQYLGRILGTAHPPGYPTYVLVSHLFSYLPVGSLAYRINLMSAIWGSASAILTFLIVRRLGASRPAAAGAAMGLALGRIFWSKAVLAEVYTLGAVLTAAVLLKLLDWREHRRDSDLYWAVGLTAVALGNHLTILFVVPALITYVLVIDARSALRPNVIAVAAVLVAAGLAQYGFIVLRTLQQAPYIEASATTLDELVAVVTARRYAGQMWTFDLPTLMHVRVPMVASLIYREAGPLAAALLVPGVYRLMRYRIREAVLLLLGIAGVLVVTLDVDADAEGFLLPAFVLMWPVVGVGIHALAAGWRGTAKSLFLPIVGGSLAAALVVLQATSNYAPNDHHRRTFERRYFQAFFDAMPDKSIVVKEDYAVDQLVLYKLLGEGAAGTRDVRLVGPDHEALWDYASRGYRVYAFERGRAELESWGFRFVPVQLFDRPLPEYLAQLPEGSVVALAASSGAASALSTGLPGGGVGSLGGRMSWSGSGRQSYGAIGIRGTARGALEAMDPSAVEIAIAASEPIGTLGRSAPVSLRARADGTVSAVAVNGEEVVRAVGGLALVVIAPDGRVVDAEAIDPARSPLVPFDRHALPLFRLTEASRCSEIGNVGWRDITPSAATGRLVVRIDNYRPFDAAVDLYLASRVRMNPRIVHIAGSGKPTLDVRELSSAGARNSDVVRSALAADGLDAAAVQALTESAYVYGASIRVNDQGQNVTIELDVGSVPSRTFGRARVDLDNPKRAVVCGNVQQ